MHQVFVLSTEKKIVCDQRAIFQTLVFLINQQSVDSSPRRDTCVLKQDT